MKPITRLLFEFFLVLAILSMIVGLSIWGGAR